MISDNELESMVLNLYSIFKSEEGRDIIDKELLKKYGKQYSVVKTRLFKGNRAVDSAKV